MSAKTGDQAARDTDAQIPQTATSRTHAQLTALNEQMFGRGSEKADALAARLGSEEFDYVPKKGVASAVEGAARLFGQQVNQWTDPKTIAAGAAGAGIAAGVGALAPTPEEVITVPAAFFKGVGAASALRNYQMESGFAYKEMLDRGVDEKTAFVLANIVGGANAGIEYIQFDKLLGGFRAMQNAGIGDEALKRVAAVLAEKAKSDFGESAQEMVQGLVTDTGVNIGTKMATGEYAYTPAELAQRAGEEFTDSLKTFAVMSAPGAVLGTMRKGTVATQDATSGDISAQDSGNGTSAGNATPAAQNGAQGNVGAQNKTLAEVAETAKASGRSDEGVAWRMVPYDDDTQRATIQQDTHARMVAEGKSIDISEGAKQAAGYYPDLRHLPKSERNDTLRAKIKELKADLRKYLTSLTGIEYEFEVNGDTIEARLYSRGIDEVMSKITQDKAGLLLSSDEIFRKAEYMYSTPDEDSRSTVARWNYFYVPIQTAEGDIGVRIAIRDIEDDVGRRYAHQIYSWGVKQNAPLDGGSPHHTDTSSGVSSDASAEGMHPLDSDDSIAQSAKDVKSSEDADLGDSLGSARAGFTKTEVEQAPTRDKSVTNGVIYNDDEKKMLAPGKHEKITEGESMARAAERMVGDTDGNVDLDRTAQDLLSDGQWTSVQTDEAMLVQQMLLERARETGQGWDDVRKIAARVREARTLAGQTLQATKKWIAQDAANIVTEAAGILEKANKGLDGKLRKGANVDDILTDVSTLAWQYQEAAEKRDADALADIIRRTAQMRGTTGLFSSDVSAAMEKALASIIADGDIDYLKNFAANGIVAIASDAVKPSAAEVALQYRRMAMLSKVSTVMRNLVSNGVFDPVEIVTNDISVPLDMLLSKITGTRSVGWSAIVSKTKAKGSLAAIARSMLEVGLDVDTDGSLQSKYEMGSRRVNSMSGNFLEKLLSSYEKYQGYALNVTDEMEKGGIRATTQKGIDSLYAKGLIKDDTLREAGQKAALYSTFQNNSPTAQLLLNARTGANTYGKKNGKGGYHVGDILIPFAQVPGNLVGVVFDYSPAGLAKSIVQMGKVIYDAKKGTLTAQQQRDAVLNFGRGLNGAAIITGAAMLALGGSLRVTDILDDDDDKEALERQSGITGTQLNLDAFERWVSGKSTAWRDGDKLVSIGFLDPINGLLTMGGLLAEDAENEELTAGSIAKDTFEGTAQAFLELPMMQTLKNFFDNLRYGGFTEAAQKLAADQMTSIVPNIVKGIAQGTDAYQRDVGTKDGIWGKALDSVKSGIPGLRETLPTKQDSFGRDMKSERDPLLRFLNNNILPGKVSTLSEDPLVAEMHRLNDKTERTDMYPDRKPPKKVTYDKVEYKLTAEQKRKYQSDYGAKLISTDNAMRETAAYKKADEKTRAELLKLAEQYAQALAKEKAVKPLLKKGEEYEQEKWVVHAGTAKSDLGLSPAEFLAAYLKYGKGEGILSGTAYDKTVKMVKAGATLDEWAKMRKGVDANGNTSVSKAELTDWLDAHYSDRATKAKLFDAYKGGQKWKNPY